LEHVGKRRPIKKKELLQCANLHLKREIEALKPKLVIIASQLACNFFWKHQTSEGQKKRTKLKEFLEDQKISLEQKNRLLQLPGYSCDTAIFPNPSPRNRWKKTYYKQYELESVKKIVWKCLNKSMNLDKRSGPKNR
jgi:hypothetical protein